MKNITATFLTCNRILAGIAVVAFSTTTYAGVVDAIADVIAPPNYLEVQEQNSCAEDRSYLVKDLERFQARDTQNLFFTDRKTKASKETAPKQCVVFAMNYFAKKLINAVDQESASFGYCSSEKGFPVHGHKAPCITDDYVNLVYNGFQDMTECLGISQKMIIPKILNESGFHINAMAPLRALDASGKILKTPLSFPLTDKQKEGRIIGGDVGIGQMTGSALADVNTSIEDWSRSISNSDKASCQRLKTILGHIPTKTDIPTEVDNRCHLMVIPKNPVHSFLLYGVLYKNNRRNVESSWEGFNVDTLLAENRFFATEEQKEKMKDTLLILSYNAGPKTAVILFKNWLISRATDKAAVALTNDDFKIAYKGPGAKIAPVIGQDEKALTNLTTTEIEALRNELAGLVKSGKAKTARAKAIQAAALNQIPFGAYLQIYRTGWAKGYLTYIKVFADTLNSELGAGTCVEDHFLSL